ncbi:transglycosylase SLT domain-containing protein [Yersinia enterocolitica]|uniref:transglycosylase SLT domain-containing protein n=1 Tax=Yersinia TaxID=629 RepID=UPI001C60E25D|nr:transglycosylase SLT domain-containing protein [Yersinia enterocolitica]MBW5812604.1 transglycosylase SLT domain-containing protein [Yersinia kristensenii]MBW5818853.1 transglycosylase SLT domain-containing protein [Yersinia kristensenii]MBW5829905.1 transglycosylase SLT domain-containing protein [Yersinia kristensenii]MBW5844477.1 transglycosylase SLT domain-containing protein [Yersinia kristensenii]
MANFRILNPILLMLLTSCMPISAKELQQIPVDYHEIAAEAQVPVELLYSLALAESSRRFKGGEHPWPWTINVAGKGYRYNTREEAWQALIQFVRKAPLKRIDVGITQVNLGWNGHLFPSFYDAFDPSTNLRVAAHILRSCYETSFGSWIKAAGCYHHPAGGKHAANYIAIVRRKLNTLPPSDIVLINNQLSWIEPK